MVPHAAPRPGADAARDKVSHNTPRADKSSDSSHTEPRELRAVARPLSPSLRLPPGVTQTPRTAANATRTPDALRWTEAPIPLGGTAVPPWPSGVLRGPVGRFVDAVATSYEVPRDLPAVCALGVLSVVFGGRAEVCVNTDWREPVNLYLAVAMPPGSLKSPVMSRFFAPLEEWEREETARLSGDIALAASKIRTAERALERAEKIAANATDDEARSSAEGDMKRAVETLEKARRENVVAPQLVTRNATPAALTTLLSKQGGRLGLVSDEGGEVFAMMAGRTGKDGAPPDLDVYLTGHSGAGVRVERVSRAAEHIPHVNLTIAVATQPDTFNVLARPDLRARGLPARFFYSVPPSNTGHRYQGEGADEVMQPVNDLVAREWRTLARKALEAVRDLEEPITLNLSAEARRAFIAWRNKTEPRLRENGGDLAPIADWCSKWGQALRVAGLLHLSERDPEQWRDAIDLDTMERAVNVVRDYFTPHAMMVFRVMGDTPAVVAARKLLAWVQREKLEAFTVRAAHHTLNRNGTRREVVDPVLEVLLSHGWIQRTPRDPAHVGRPSETYSVHPRAFAAR